MIAHGSGVAIETVYQHGYDPVLARCDPRAANASCGDQAAYVSGQLLREARWAVWHALGLANWIWS